MSGCQTCGSIDTALPSPDQYSESVKCNCGFRARTQICGKCYVQFPHNKDAWGVDVSCPKCNKFVAYFDKEKLDTRRGDNW